MTNDIEIVIQTPGQVQTLATEVRTATTVAQYSTSIAGPSAGAAVGRIASVRSLVLCSETTAVVQGMLSLPIDVCGDSAGADARGAILGNLVLWTAVSGLMAVVVAAYERAARITFLAAAQIIGAPSQLLPVVVVTVPSTVSGTFYLLHSPACTLDAVLATLGVMMCVSPLAVLSVLAFVVPQHFVTHRIAKAAEANHCCLPPKLYLLVIALFPRRVRWVDKKLIADDGTTTETTTFEIESAVSFSWLRRATTVVLLEYAAVWYVVLDLAVLTVLGLLGAVSSLESATACHASAVVVVLLFAGQLVVCAVMQPFTTLFSHVYTLFTLVLSTVAAVCQVWFLFGTQAGGVDPDFLSRLLTASAVCDLLVSAVSIIRTLLDGSDAVRACYRNATKLSHLRAASPPATALLDCVCPLPSIVEVSKMEATLLQEDDAHFLDLGDDGIAFSVADDDDMIAGGAEGIDQTIKGGDVINTTIAFDDENDDVIGVGEKEGDAGNEQLLLLFEHGPRSQDMLRSFYLPPAPLPTRNN